MRWFLVLLAACGSPPPPVSEPIYVPPPPSRPVVIGTTPLWCFTMPGNPMIGGCFTNEDKCRRIRADMSSGTDCEMQTTAACFNFTWVLTGNRDVDCSPSVAYCEEQLRDAREDPDRQVSAVQCGIYRVGEGE